MRWKRINIIRVQIQNSEIYYKFSSFLNNLTSFEEEKADVIRVRRIWNLIRHSPHTAIFFFLWRMCFWLLALLKRLLNWNKFCFVNGFRRFFARGNWVIDSRVITKCNIAYAKKLFVKFYTRAPNLLKKFHLANFPLIRPTRSISPDSHLCNW